MPPMPLTDDDTVDVVGVRKDGGIDMVVSAVGPIDDSPETLDLLRRKLQNYIAGATSEEFLRYYGRPLGTRVTIYISCAYPISPAARNVIDQARSRAAQQQISVEVTAAMGSSH